ncbi:MAG: ATP synthase F0 subunit B [Desulfobacterales bacterium]|jgi:F-type H+-transporting ATPase subunit b|nr:ATP synthase F0 subunit B [Desulfobacterales bacterium]
MEIVTQTELVSINATMIAQVLSFLIFLFLIQRVMFRPLRDTMSARRADLKRIEGEIRGQEKQMAELSSKMQKETAALKAEAFLESEKLETEGQQAARSILAQTREQIASQQRTASEDVRRRIEAAQQELAREVESLAAAIMEKVLERRLKS